MLWLPLFVIERTLKKNNKRKRNPPPPPQTDVCQFFFQHPPGPSALSPPELILFVVLRLPKLTFLSHPFIDTKKTKKKPSEGKSLRDLMVVTVAPVLHCSSKWSPLPPPPPPPRRPVYLLRSNATTGYMLVTNALTWFIIWFLSSEGIVFLLCRAGWNRLGREGISKCWLLPFLSDFLFTSRQTKKDVSHISS